MSVSFTPWSVGQAFEGKKVVGFYAWRFNNGAEERREPHDTFAAALALCGELNRQARETPEWKAHLASLKDART